jgi:hypothetical protein
MFWFGVGIVCEGIKPVMYVSYKEIIKDCEMTVDVESFLVATMTCFVSQMTTDIFHFS